MPRIGEAFGVAARSRVDLNIAGTRGAATMERIGHYADGIVHRDRAAPLGLHAAALRAAADAGCGLAARSGGSAPIRSEDAGFCMAARGERLRKPEANDLLVVVDHPPNAGRLVVEALHPLADFITRIERPLPSVARPAAATAGSARAAQRIPHGRQAVAAADCVRRAGGGLASLRIGRMVPISVVGGAASRVEPVIDQPRVGPPVDSLRRPSRYAGRLFASPAIGDLEHGQRRIGRSGQARPALGHVAGGLPGNVDHQSRAGPLADGRDTRGEIA